MFILYPPGCDGRSPKAVHPRTTVAVWSYLCFSNSDRSWTPLRIPLRTLPSLDSTFAIGKERTDWSTIPHCYNMVQTRLGPDLSASFKLRLHISFLYNYITSQVLAALSANHLVQNLSLSRPHSHPPLSLDNRLLLVPTPKYISPCVTPSSQSFSISYPNNQCQVTFLRCIGSVMSLTRYPIIPERPSQISVGLSSGLGHSHHEPRPPPHWQQYFSKSSNDLIARYTHGSSLSPSKPVWLECAALSAGFHGVDSRPRPSTVAHSTHGQYPESSQRTRLPPPPSFKTFPSSPVNLPLSPSPEVVRHALPTKFSEALGSDFYTIDDTESLCPPSRFSTPSVKPEPDDHDGGFIMDASTPSIFEHTLAPPTEVPLRATKASKEMRKMMGVFRLNPFTVYNVGDHGVPMSSWNGETPGPLQEEPRLYDFELVLEGAISDEELRCFSPESEISNSSVESNSTPPNEWDEYHARNMPQSPSPSLRWPSFWDHPNTHIYPLPTPTSASLELGCPDSSPDRPQGGNAASDYRHRRLLINISSTPASFPFRNPLNTYAAQQELSASQLRELPIVERDDTHAAAGPHRRHTQWNDYLRHPPPSNSVHASESAVSPFFFTSWMGHIFDMLMDRYTPICPLNPLRLALAPRPTCRRVLLSRCPLVGSCSESGVVSNPLLPRLPSKFITLPDR